MRGRTLFTILIAALFACCWAAGAAAADKKDIGNTDNGRVGGDTISTATVIPSLPYSDTGDTSAFVDDYDEVCPFTGSTSPDVVYQYTAATTGYVSIDLGGSAYDTKVYVYRNTVGNLWGCNDDYAPYYPEYTSFIEECKLFAGETYYIVVDGYGGSSGTYELSVAGIATPTEGACCLPEDPCEILSEYHCQAVGGDYPGDGSECSICECPPDSLFGQERNDLVAYSSDLDNPYSVADNFTGISGPICDVHFWGVYYDYVLGAACTELPPQDFVITFYHDAGGLPGAVACTYPVSIEGSDTGTLLGGIPVLYFETDLSPCCTLSDGWVSIAGTGGDPDCHFYWSTSSDGDTASAGSADLVAWEFLAYDFAFCLTPEEAVPDETTVALTADRDCYETGDTVTAWVNLVTPEEAITGGQFFLDYDNTVLDFEGFGPGSDPFDNLIYEVADEGTGTLDVAVGVDLGEPGTMVETVMAELTFTALQPICDETGLVAFRPHDPPTRLSTATGGHIEPIEIDLDIVDTEAPLITCPPDVTIECDAPIEPAPLWDHKMHFPQLPDPYGWDVHSSYTPDAGWCFAADDWECSETGPVEDIHFWGSWLSDIDANPDIEMIELLIFSDIPDPDGDGPLYSMPGTLLWNAIVLPGQFTITEEGPYDPPSIQGYYSICNGVVLDDDHQRFFRYDIPDIGSFTSPFVQTQGEVYWLNVLIRLSNTPDVSWGWKTSLDHWNDSATTGDGLSWDELLDPLTTEPLDLAFVITDGPMRTGEAAATDNCDPAPVLTWSDVIDYNGCGGYTGTITRTWTATDHCGNSSSCTQTITVVDNIPPAITCPGPVSVQCSGQVPAPDTAQVTATDTCDLAPVVTHMGDVSDGMSCPETITRTYRATDACGNWAECTQLITVDDTVAPSITCPLDIIVNADAGGCDAVVTWTVPTATDNCDPSPTVVCSPPPGSTFSGTTTVTCTATDDCGNSSFCSFNVTVLPFNDLNVTLELSPTIDTGDPFPQTLTRCITFELWDCGPPSGPTVLQRDVNFNVTQPGGPGTPILAVGPAIIDDVPCGLYTCITARDELHTLRRTMDLSLSLDGTDYEADFATALKPLIGGNLNGDGWVDILDFGVFSWQHYTDYGTGDTPCVTAYPHADVSGDGLVDTDDFSFVQINFLEGAEADCCGGLGPVPDGPVTSITVEELIKRGLKELIVADYNGDGVLNTTDITVFMGGQYLKRNEANTAPIEE